MLVHQLSAVRLCLTMMILGLVATSASADGSGGYPGAPDLHPGVHAIVAEATARSESAEPRPALEHELSLLSHLNVGTSSDVWAHGDYAYIGGLAVQNSTQVVVFPVRIVDISDPTNPTLVTSLPTPADGSSPQDVKVAHVNTAHFNGDLLVVGNDGFPGGIELWDVSDPTQPALLSAPRIGPVHNTFLYSRGNRAYVLLAIPFAEVFSSLLPPFETFGDVVIVDVTDPTNPEVVSDWGAGKDGGFPYGADLPGFPVPCNSAICRGALPAILCHDVSANEQGTVAYLSYWDLGLIMLDISDPAHPSFLGWGLEPPSLGSDDGDGHIAVPARGGKLVLVGDEDFNPLPWGFLRIFDVRDPSAPIQVGAYATDGALNDPFSLASMHNIHVRGSRAYLSWYEEGIRVIDFSLPDAPREVAAFQPPPGTGPGVFWGISVHRDLILGTDIGSGLFILKHEDEASGSP